MRRLIEQDWTSQGLIASAKLAPVEGSLVRIGGAAGGGETGGKGLFEMLAG